MKNVVGTEVELETGGVLTLITHGPRDHWHPDSRDASPFPDWVKPLSPTFRRHRHRHESGHERTEWAEHPMVRRT